MHVFVTGGAGFVGQAVIPELLGNGHTVLALARSDTTAKLLGELGAQVHRGDLEDLESLKNGAQATDGTIHLAFVHDFDDFSKFPNSCAIDRNAIAAMADAMTGTNKPLIITSGLLLAKEGELATEDLIPNRTNALAERIKSEDLISRLSKEKQIRGQIVRLTPTVYGSGDRAFVPMLIQAARKNGVVLYTADGSKRWPTVHRADAATLYRLALEKGTSDARYHAVAEQGIAMKDIMAVIGEKLGLSVESVSPEEAMQKLGFLGAVINIDNYASSQKTREELGWEPSRQGLLAEMAASYF